MDHAPADPKPAAAATTSSASASTSSTMPVPTVAVAAAATARAGAARALPTSTLPQGMLRIARAPAAGRLAGRTVRGIVFDMDGTLTVPILDFALMRTRLSLRAGEDILAHVHALPETSPVRIRAETIIREMEHEAMLAMEMAPGYHALMQFLESARIPKAILTRNNMDPVDHLLQHHASGYKFEPVVTRDTVRPTKPFPDPLEHIARLWNIPAAEILMVGDGTDDVKCAQAAGAMACYVHTIDNGAHHALVDPDTRIEHLDELRALLLEVE
ncbi:hypothetical protein GGF32_009940 [Allomyces javanicus]|nr:hypothetical protein GGF32_009940 [Allomyces javanicus]